MALNMDAVLRNRLTYVPAHAELAAIPWPVGMEPAEQASALQFDGSLPPADVLVITWTSAEAMALADVLTPGAPSTSWVHYAKNWDKFESQLTGRSPAREAKRLGEFHMTRIGTVTVCCFHSQLHPATDAASLPAAQLAAQIAADTGARLVITTGTAGGAGDGTVLGDINVASHVRSDFTSRLKGRSWSQETWATTPPSAQQQEVLRDEVLTPLFAANSGRLPQEYATRPPKAWYGDTVSTDFFAFDTQDDHYGLRAYDPQIRMVEMDDAAIALGVLGLAAPPMFASVRNASDPVMPSASEAEAKLASQIYEKYGYFTTVNSAIGTWALCAGLDQE